MLGLRYFLTDRLQINGFKKEENGRKNRTMIVNKHQMADVMGVSERTLSEWQEDGLPIKSVGGRGMDNQYETAEVIEWRVQRAVAGKSVMTPRDRRDLADAQLSELELARESRKLVSIEEVGPVW